MRIYEELFIVKPNATEEEIDALNNQLDGVIKKTGGKLEKIDKWGVRTLAFRVKKQNEGYYVLLSFHAAPDTVKEIERRLRVSDMVLKFITVRMDEKLKWLEKRKKRRDARAARRPAPPPPSAIPSAPASAPGAPAAPAPAAPMPGAPGAPGEAAAAPPSGENQEPKG